VPERKTKEREETAARARGIWSGTVTFGLVSIPVALMPANRPGGPRFRMLGADGTPLARRWVCSEEGRPLTDDDIARGYEVRKGKWVIVEDEELEALEPKKSHDIELQEFVSCDDIDPLYFERGYYLVPAGGSTKAYALLARIMEDTSRAAMATFVMHEREHLVALLATNGILRAELFRFSAETRTAEDAGLPEPKRPDAARVAALRRAMGALEAKTLDEDLLRDEFGDKVAAAARKKLAQRRDVVEVEATTEPEETTVDLMRALRKALGSRGPGRGVAPARRAGSGRPMGGRRKRKRGAAGAAAPEEGS
jgi:DNA end-binding protein Ku